MAVRDYRSWEVTCDECGHSEDDVAPDANSKKQVRIDLALDGWLRLRGWDGKLIDVCSECAEQKNENN